MCEYYSIDVITATVMCHFFAYHCNNYHAATVAVFILLPLCAMWLSLFAAKCCNQCIKVDILPLLWCEG